MNLVSRIRVRSGTSRAKLRQVLLARRTARLAVGCAFVLLSAAQGACLITDRIERAEENFPPYVSTEAPSIVSQVPPFPNCPGQPPPAVGSGENLPPFEGPWMRFVARVSDPNIDDVLYGRVVVNRGSRPNKASPDQIPTTGSLDRGAVEFCVDASDLNRACNHVELLVSRRFPDNHPDYPYGPEEEGDLGRAVWVVRGFGQNAPASSEEDCLALFDGAVP